MQIKTDYLPGNSRQCAMHTENGCSISMSLLIKNHRFKYSHFKPQKQMTTAPEKKDHQCNSYVQYVQFPTPPTPIPIPLPSLKVLVQGVNGFTIEDMQITSIDASEQTITLSIPSTKKEFLAQKLIEQAE